MFQDRTYREKSRGDEGENDGAECDASRKDVKSLFVKNVLNRAKEGKMDGAQKREPSEGG